MATANTDNSDEEWRECNEDKDYVVSNKGNVKSYKQNKKGRTLFGKSNKDGRRFVYLGGKQKRVVPVARLVAKAFVNNPLNYPTVDHINRDPSNDSKKNLRYASYKLQAQNRNKPRKVRTLEVNKRFFRVQSTVLKAIYPTKV